MTDVERLVCSIIQFLEDQLKSGDLTSDAAESLEVAIQCLEQAYCVTHDNAPSQLPSLLELFRTSSHRDPINRSPTPEVSQEKKKEAENLKNKGNDLMKGDKFAEAVQCYTRAIEIDSHNAIYYCNRAAAYSKLNNHPAAIVDCDRAIKIDCTYSKAYGRKGLAHASLGQHREAKICYEKAAKLDPTNESYINNLHIAEEKLKETNLHNPPPMQGRQVPPSTPQSQQIPPGAGMFGLESSNFNLSNLLSNPALMNMATQMMTDPNMQQLLGNFLSGSAGSGGGAPPPSGPAPSAAPPPAAASGGPAGVQALLQAGQQLAAQMQASNPELVEQLRQQMSSGNSDGANPSSREQTPK